MTHTFDTKARQELKTQSKLFNPLEWNGKKPKNRCFALPNFSYGKTTLNNNIICNLKNPLVSREQLNINTGATQ